MNYDPRRKLQTQLDLIDDSICVYALISTRGPNREEDYNKILAERTKEFLTKGWTVSPTSPSTFLPPKKDL